jgi:hypothetical protein
MRGSAIEDKNSWGRNANDSRCMGDVPIAEELRYKRVLYGEKLWR